MIVSEQLEVTAGSEFHMAIYPEDADFQLACGKAFFTTR